MTLFWRWLHHATQQVKTQQIFVTVSIRLLYICARHRVLYDLICLILVLTQLLNREVKYLTQGVLRGTGSFWTQSGWRVSPVLVTFVNQWKVFTVFPRLQVYVSCLATLSCINTTNRFMFKSEGWWFICIN